METLDCVVVGAGVIGLACARLLSRSGREVVIVERESAFGCGISARNSEVIHAGLYYPAGSFKSRLCISGRPQLYRFCQEHAVAHARPGKLVVACDDAQAQQLGDIHRNAQACGVNDLRRIGPDELAELEPALHARAALLSPSTGIVDSHGLMAALLHDAERHGAMLAVQSPLVAGRIDTAGRIVLTVGEESGTMDVACRTLINAAGLSAPRLAAAIAAYPRQALPQARMAKGSYFSLRGKPPFSHLIYPIPVPGGLGTHLTLDLAGQARFGPNVRWIQEEDYRVDPAEADAFYAAIRTYWPGLPDGALDPAYAGIRPKISGPGEAAADFLIDGPQRHGIPGLVNLFGMESPGLTASLAIADHVLTLL
ncbi:NAD(P)/FAD-dependent oxidoreductase [Paludibacterium yongneupense]|uniref:NAD(P)/FAD-dependent oxidoreductase n=1 Tax=Paludibacterium yongneupense TaxID=400061 RepID=UPI00041C1871|nr:NAD(P)/FAD-dependent oxidoreductase [Paludibacterium yongneupense]